MVTTTSPSWCFSHSCDTQGFPGSGQDSPGCKEAQASRVSAPPQAPPSSRGQHCLCPQPAASTGSPRASARSMPCNDSCPRALVHQGPARSVPAVTLPTGQPTGRDGPEPEPGQPWVPGRLASSSACRAPVAHPTQNLPQGPATRTHIEEVGGAVTGVHDTGHLHAQPTALPALHLVLEALWGRGGCVA